METAVTTTVGILLIIGAAFPLIVAVAFFKESDAISRINALGPATALGLPLIVLGTFIGWTWFEGFSPVVFIKSLLTITALILVSSVASNILARAAYMSGAPLDRRTSPNDLANDPNPTS